jgi:tetratricopeptide (TPR) repeat protein
LSWLSKNDSLKALSWFTKVDKNFERVNEFTKKCRENLRGSIDVHFKNGLKFYQSNNYKDAAAEWKSVLEIDPDHKQAKEYMKKVNKKLPESRKKSRQ